MLHHNEHLALPRPAPFRLSSHSSGWRETLSILGRREGICSLSMISSSSRNSRRRRITEIFATAFASVAWRVATVGRLTPTRRTATVSRPRARSFFVASLERDATPIGESGSRRVARTSLMNTFKSTTPPPSRSRYARKFSFRRAAALEARVQLISITDAAARSR